MIGHDVGGHPAGGEGVDGPVADVEPVSGAAGATEPATDLVVAFAFAPYVDTAAIVAAKRVREAGRPVDVLQNEMSSQRATDPALDRIAGHLVRRRAVLRTPTLFSSWRGVEAFVAAGLDQALEWDADGPGYQRVYSRAHWVPSHFLAARLASLRPHLRWTAEFSDPLSVYVDARERHTPVEEGPLLEQLTTAVREAGFAPPGDNLFSWVETLPYALADELVFTNDNQRDLMLGRIGDEALAARARERAVVAPHPTLPPAFYGLAHEGRATDRLAIGRTSDDHPSDVTVDLEPGVRHIGYFGNFYGNRNMSAVVTALGALPTALRESLQLDVFTAKPEALMSALERVSGAGAARVRARPFVPYLDFLALSTRMDALLINDAATRRHFPVNPFLPSKWSDYQGSGRPVWGVVEAGSPLSAQPLDYRSPVQHVSAAVQVLAQIART